MTTILDRINSPADVKTLTLDEMAQLAEELRALIIKTVSTTGGHLAANLGTVELTLALLHVFDPPGDKLIWDVSHQTYAYKILTGRKPVFHTLRQTDGISGFLLRSESPYDAFGAGHAGTALSAALGMAVARDLRQGPEHIVAIVGDGALGCGSSFEALNNLAFTTQRLIVILNDNEMSIAANVGSVAHYLGKLLAHPRYNRWKTSVERFAKDRLRLTWLRHIYFRLEEAVKSLFLHNVLFEEFGLRYIGPIDGHNMRTLVSALETARRSDEPILLHVSTQKGKGYPFAEEEPEAWHGTGAFECETGRSLAAAKTMKYSEVFGQTLERLAGENTRLVAITAAMAAGTGLSGFSKAFPARFFDVGIAEEHAVIFAAGLAAEGLAPVVAVYSTFAQRIVDYVIHDVCLQRLPVIFCLDRAGVVGDDGPTHHGIFDITLFRSVPNLILMHPKDEAELAHMLYSATRWNRPVMIRYPRGGGPGAPLPETLTELPFGKAEILREGRDIQLWALGDMIPLACHVADRLQQNGVNAGIVNPRFITPLDQECLKEHAASTRIIVTMENAALSGGFGSAVGEVLAEAHFPGVFLRFGWPDQFIPHGAFNVLCERFGLTESAITAAILKANRLLAARGKKSASV
ncbi:MAG: 1-deoxy-D-xylulose-5-phosphate synthase [Verrucomicrobia bacterium]|nr:1-deoxy-D-xylulose-5-phosphate synthase [Verrucomicrobiota bacterium]MCG2680578.1 1-deoxy-D-xylulose-5-phosphate synthase [Kiritimatiellia bacterium]MBU4247518.1 1-deoxy-D-xylulose-5-phosphate synthase [Verrucomicrobiota bacterium]MBU4290292.1 1-deoxy-D-xylulose-5-phosphate synthase [Verrucomicrobiota bacterium]MBU4429482.1 1-deoxy-D-xylulose-5-phosphate synthase [Verrucomicrobiota bacterium]